MTIPTRPAPAPPSAANAAAGANASLERLRLQLEQQQQQLQQQQQIQQLQQRTIKNDNRMSIKLPPPPTKSSYYQPPPSVATGRSNNYEDVASTSSITRKFPIARYAPATNWDDSPFDSMAVFKHQQQDGRKVPPPRPPPPKMNNARKPVAPAPPISPRPPTSVNILTSIFNRKKQAKAAQSSRIYGVSAGVANTHTKTSHAWHSNSSSNSNYHSNSIMFNNYANNMMNSGFDTCATKTTTTTSMPHEAQLISFDSPPSSPTFTQKSNSDCVSVDSFSSDSNFSSPNNGSASQTESGFEDDFGSVFRSRQSTTSPLDPWETIGETRTNGATENLFMSNSGAPVRNLNSYNVRQSQDNVLCNGKNLLPPLPSLQMPTIIKPKIAQKPKAPKPPSYMQQSSSLLDVISGKADAMDLAKHESSGFTDANDDPQASPYGVALYDFEGVEDGDLSFRENEKIYLLEKMSEEWYRGRTRSGCEGIFPINYIEVKVALPANCTDASQPAKQTAYQWPTATSLYNFPAEVDGDLALKENDVVKIYYKINDDWLYGEVDGRQGQFPSNFLDNVPANLGQMPST